jgi:putative membrane protein
MPMLWYGSGWGGVLFMLFSMIFWAAVLGVLAWGVVRWLTTPARSASGPSAMEILRQRFARGEIDAATFEQMRDRLEAAPDRVSRPGAAS